MIIIKILSDQIGQIKIYLESSQRADPEYINFNEIIFLNQNLQPKYFNLN